MEINNNFMLLFLASRDNESKKDLILQISMPKMSRNKYFHFI